MFLATKSPGSACSRERQPLRGTGMIPMLGLVVKTTRPRTATGAHPRRSSSENPSIRRGIGPRRTLERLESPIVLGQRQIEKIHCGKISVKQEYHSLRYGGKIQHERRRHCHNPPLFKRGCERPPCRSHEASPQNHARDASPSAQDKATAGQLSPRWSQRPHG